MPAGFKSIFDDLESPEASAARPAAPDAGSAPEKPRNRSAARRYWDTVAGGWRTAVDVAAAIPETVVQNVKDVNQALTEAQVGAITAIPKLVTGVPVIGDAAKAAVRAGDELLERQANRTGASRANPGVSASKPVGTLAIDTLTGAKLFKGAAALMRRTPGLRALIEAEETLRRAKVTQESVSTATKVKSAAGQVLKGQAVAGAIAVADAEVSVEEALKTSAAVTGFILGMPVVGRAIGAAARKVAPTRVGQVAIANFRWLGRVGDDVRAEFDRYFRTVAAGEAEAKHFAENNMKLSPIERMRQGQIIRSGATGLLPNREQVTAAGRKAYEQLTREIDGVRLDISIPLEVRQVRVRQLRGDQRAVLETMREADAGHYFGTRTIVQSQIIEQGVAQRALASVKKADDAAYRARDLIDPESAAAERRGAIPSVVYHRPLTSDQMRARREAKDALRGELDKLGLDVEYHNVSTQRVDLAQRIARETDPAKRAELSDRLGAVISRQAAIADMYTRAGVGGDSVLRRVTARLDNARADIESTRRRLDAGRAASRELRQRQTVAATELDRARRPLTPEQQTAVADAKEADLLANTQRDAPDHLISAQFADRALRLPARLRASASKEILGTLEHDLKLRDVERIATVDERLRRTAELVRLTDQEVKVLERDLVALKDEVRRLERVPRFPGRAALINDTMEKIDEINRSIATSYKFGGTNYSPRMYLSKEQEEVVTRYGIFGPRRDATLREQRDVMLPEHVRRAMGEIIDPTYPIAEKTRQLVRDRAAYELFDGLARNGSAVVDEAAYQALDSKAKRLFVELQGSDRRLGPLAGKYAHKDIAGEIEQVAGVGQRGWRIYNSLMNLWKVNKTALNPATHFRNIFSNTIFLDLAGVPVHAQPGAYNSATRHMTARSALWRDFERSGLAHSTHAAADLQTISGITAPPLRDADEWFERLPRLYQNAPGVKQMISAYAAEDKLARFIVFDRARTELGLGVADAARYVDRYIPNYRTIARNPMTTGVGVYSPFFKFTWAAMPIMARNAVEQPVKLAKWYAVGQVVNQLAADVLGIPEEEQQAVREVLPSYMQRSDVFAPSVLPMLPRQDRYGRLMFLDASYWVPLNNMVDGSDSLLPIQFLEPGNPMLRAFAEVWLNKQGYNGQPIYDPTLDVDQSLSERFDRTFLTASGWAKVGDYLAKNSLPTLAGWGRERITRAVTGEGDYLGRVQDVPTAIADAIFGVKIRAVDPDEQLGFRIRETKAEIRETKKRLRSIESHQGKTLTQREQERADAEKQLEALQRRLESLAELKLPARREE